MGNIEMYKANIVQVRQPAPPPPPPPKSVASYTASSVQAYVPGSGTSRPPAAGQPVVDAAGKSAFTAVDLTAPKARGTQPLELPKDWMESLPPTATEVLKKLAGPAADAGADKALKAVIAAMGGNMSSLPAGAATAIVDALASGKLTVPAGIGGSKADNVSAMGDFGVQLMNLSQSNGAVKALTDMPAVREALFAFAVSQSMGISGSSTQGVDSNDPIPAYAKYEVPTSSFEDYFQVDEKRRPNPGTTPFDALYDAMNTYVTPKGKLSAEETKAIWDFYGTATVNASPEAADKVATEIYNLLQRDRLTAPDAFGKTALDYFEQFSKAPKAWQLGSTSKAQIARELLDTMVHPINVSQGKGTLDCAEATLQSQLAFEHPADYARIAVGLTTRGQADIPGANGTPEKLRLPQLNFADQAGRPMLDFAVQSALANYVGAKPNQGLTSGQVDSIQDAVVGTDYVTLSKLDFIKYSSYLLGKDDTDNRVNDIVKGGFGATLKVTMNIDGAQHSMAVMKIRMDGASLWDPASGKIFKVPLDTVLHDMVRVSAPKSWVLDNFEVLGDASSETEGGLKAGTKARKG